MGFQVFPKPKKSPEESAHFLFEHGYISEAEYKEIKQVIDQGRLIKLARENFKKKLKKAGWSFSWYSRATNTSKYVHPDCVGVSILVCESYARMLTDEESFPEISFYPKDYDYKAEPPCPMK